MTRYEADKKAKKGRREASVKEIFDALATARQQIVELVEFVGEGRLLRLAARAGMRKAKVALARKLAVVLHRMLADGTNFLADKAAAAATR